MIFLRPQVSPIADGDAELVDGAIQQRVDGCRRYGDRVRGDGDAQCVRDGDLHGAVKLEKEIRSGVEIDRRRDAEYFRLGSKCSADSADYAYLCAVCRRKDDPLSFIASGPQSF